MDTANEKVSPADSNAIERFLSWRYGLFVHWGTYALLGRGEQVLFREHLIPSEYAKLARRFRPSKYDARQWARDAKAAGMRYGVLTTKHHDGFCLFHSKHTDYCATKTGPKRDLVGEFIEGFRAEGLGVGLYYSLPEWINIGFMRGRVEDPGGWSKYVDYVHAQVDELCSNYGPIDILWFDGEKTRTVEEWRGIELAKLIRGKQPSALINDRLGFPGDYDTSEQRIVASGAGRPWEACMTTQRRWWGWHQHDRHWRTARDVIGFLADTAGGGGNLLLNVGPKPDGTWPAQFRRNLDRTAEWLRVNGEAIYGTSGGVCEMNTIGQMTVKDSAAYLIILHWPAPELHLSGLATDVKRASLLATGQSLTVRRHGEHILVGGLPRRAPDADGTVIKLELEGPARGYPWASERLWRGDMRKHAAWAKT